MKGRGDGRDAGFATVAVLVVTVIVVAEVTFRGVTIDLDGSTTVGVEVHRRRWR